MTTTTAGPTAAPTPGATDATPAGTEPQAGKQEAAAQAQARKLRLRGLDGDMEQEYDEGHVIGLAKRGKNAAQLVSLAEKKAQEALKRERDVEAKLARLKDPKTARAALRELGVDVRGMSTEEILEAVEEEKLTPEQKRIRDLERKAAERDEADAKAKSDKETAELEAETQRHLDELATTFQEVMALADLPRESATVVGYRVASIYQAAEAAGTAVDPELAAERVKSALKAEHKAIFTKKDGTLDVGALVEWVGPEGMQQLRKAAVQEYLATRRGGAPAPQQTEPQRPAAQQQRNGQHGPKRGSAEWWRQQQGL